MRNIKLLFTIFFISISSGYAADISIIIYLPEQNQIVDTLLRIEVSVLSTYEIEYVRASVAELQTDLVYSEGKMIGSLNLNGMLRGVKTLNIKAVDIFSNELNVTRDFIYDRKPVLNILNPVQNDLASPVLNIETNYWNDNISGGSIIVSLDDELLFTKIASFDTSVDLTAWAEGEHLLKISAYDSLNQYVEHTRDFQLVKSAGLVLKYFMEYPVMDIDSSKILSGSGKYIQIKNYKTGITDYVTLPRDLFVRYMYLINNGFLSVLEPESAYLHDSVFEWKNGTLSNLGPANSTYSLVVKNKWAIWNEGKVLMLRNNESGSVANMANNTINWNNDLSSDGLVAYGTSDPDYQIYSFKNGQTHQLTHYGMNTYPLTDGNKFLYRRADTLILNDGSGETALSLKPDMWPKHDYNINNGWIAYCKIGEIGQYHVWLRNPEGQEKKITYFGTNSTIMGLNNDGQCVFRNQDNLYLADFSGKIKRFTSLINGSPVWLDNELYYISVNAIFKVDTTLTGIDNNYKQSTNSGFHLLQNYPNPFNSSSVIKYSVKDHGLVSLKIFDILGKEIKILVDEEKAAGTYKITWNAKNLPSGVYFCQLKAGNFIETKKMILMR